MCCVLSSLSAGAGVGRGSEQPLPANLSRFHRGLTNLVNLVFGWFEAGGPRVGDGSVCFVLSLVRLVWCVYVQRSAYSLELDRGEHFVFPFCVC